MYSIQVILVIFNISFTCGNLAFSSNQKMVSIFHEELESGIGEVHKVGGHAAEDEKQIQTLSMYINHTGSVHMNYYSCD